MLSILNKMKIRTTSVVWAVQDVNEYYYNSSKVQYEELITQLTGVQVVAEDRLSAEITFKYIVQGIIQDELQGTKQDILDIIKTAVYCTTKLISEQGQYMRTLRNTDVVTESVDGVKITRTVTSRSGVSKSVQANTIIEQNKLLDKPVVIEILSNELSITKANASVYYYKWNKKQ